MFTRPPTPQPIPVPPPVAPRPVIRPRPKRALAQTSRDLRFSDAMAEMRAALERPKTPPPEVLAQRPLGRVRAKLAALWARLRGKG